MPLIETAATGLAKAVVTRAVGQWLGHRQARDARSLDLSELVATTFRDRIVRRKAEAQVRSLVTEVTERIEQTFATEYGNLPEHEVAATLDTVGRVVTHGVASDEQLFAADADPARLTRALQPAYVAAAERAGLSEAATRLGERVLADCVRCHVELVRHLPEFTNRASQEILARFSRLSADLAEVLARLPAPPSADAGDDGSFEQRYGQFVSTHHDQLELFGVDVHNFTPETTLSIAYLSLSVTDSSGGGSRRTRALRPHAQGAFGRLVDADASKGLFGDIQIGLRVEGALGHHRRVLLRGEAGSGKSTLLRWLVINAARRTFTGELQDWNGRVPFLVKLRAYADRPLPPVGPQLGDDIAQFATEAPAGWVERIFAEGRALLLVDGVDELVSSQRAGVREWLRRILHRYPGVIVVVTSRPTAAPARWLANEDFTTLALEQMSPADIVVFVRRWHRAIGGARHLPCQADELPRYERRLLARLEANRHLRGLATNPLMCAMLCALNLDRGDDLPHDRISLYQAALDMLLERRDTARNVPAYRRVGLGAQHARTLLQDLAWRLAISNRSELDTGQAREHVTRKLATMPKVTAEPADVFEHLLDRSGVLKDVAEDRLSFVHRTFQEYLAAKEIAEENYVDALLEQAGRDIWRETVIMTAGLANSEYRQRLINGLLDRADAASDRKQRWLRLLAAACVETAPGLTPAMQARIDVSLVALLPPRSKVEARSLALAGERVLDYLPDDLTELTPSVAAAVVTTAAYVGGPRALEKLSRYGADARGPVIDALIRAADHFEPDEYGRRVLADSPLQGGSITVDEWTAPMTRHLRHLRDVQFIVQPKPEVLRALPPICGLYLFAGISGPIDREIDALRAHPELESLYVNTPLDPAAIPATLTRLRTLIFLFLPPPSGRTNLSWLTRSPQLTVLSLWGIYRPYTWRPLTQLPELNDLFLSAATDRHPLDDVAFLRQLPALVSLGLSGCSDPAVLDHVAAHRSLKRLVLNWLDVPVLDLASIRDLPLEVLDLRAFAGPLDLTPLAGHPTLETVELSACVGLTDLGPLATMPRLRTLRLNSAGTTATGLDLGPLRDSPRLTVYANPDQRLHNREGVRVRR
ncbi:NACHT domain-containing protein [Micromonospora sagamiensis]|uniref:NACHT domain-containing protein n=1 Tax=Micromonospora sagamiensis TaxID=47875 RepID=A0A562WBI5_9ACTN|nr:NACHT domain-containing protein [Micromonospora sagamiensis]TWJ27576.1 NACHT domain-containing protein [Micromonospora sagamiensis]BCL13539.1 ATP-binding protein [Micromonospora sagamiensis]